MDTELIPYEEFRETIDVTALTRFYHGQLKRAADRVGGQSALAKLLGVRPDQVNGWILFKSCPPEAPNRWWTAEQLERLDNAFLEHVGSLMSELWPQSLRKTIRERQNRGSTYFQQHKRVELIALNDYLEDQRSRLAAPDPTDPIEAQELRDLFEEAFEGLSFREREILKLRWGLGDGYCYSLREVGRVFQVSQNRLHQIESRAMRKLEMYDCGAKLRRWIGKPIRFEETDPEEPAPSGWRGDDCD